MVISLRGVQHIAARWTRNRSVSGCISPELSGYTHSQKPKHPAKAGRLGCCGGYIGERSIQVLVFVFCNFAICRIHGITVCGKYFLDKFEKIMWKNSILKI